MSASKLQVSDLSAIADISKELDAKEVALSDSIKQLLSKRRELNNRFVELSCSLPDFNLLQSNAAKLSNIVGVTSDIASELSNKVRKLDLVKSRVLQCVSKLNDIIDLKSSAVAVSAAFERGDYEDAAEHVRKYLDTESEILHLAEKLFSDVSAQKSVATLKVYQEKLCKLTCDRFDEAVAANDQPGIERFNKIFPLIGLDRKGLDKFSQYLCSLVAKKAAGHLKLSELSSSDRETPVHLDLLTEILEYCAEVLQTNQVTIEKSYGPGCLFSVIRMLQAECDRLVQVVLDRFRSHHKLSDLLRVVHSTGGGTIGSNYSGLTSLSSSQIAGARAVGGNVGQPMALGSSAFPLDTNARFERTLVMEPIISEIVLLNTRSELYLRFMRRRTAADIYRLNINESDQEKKLDEMRSFFNNCQMVRQMQDLISVYISLEEFYLREMVIRATAFDEIDEVTHTYRLADDVFFVLKKCISRSLSSGSVDSACAVLNHICSVLLDHVVANSLEPRVRAGFPSGWMQDAFSYMQTSVAAVAPSSGSVGMASMTSSSALSAIGLSLGGSSGIGSGTLTTPAGAAGVAGGASSSSVVSASATSSVATARYQFLTTLNTVETCMTNLNSLVAQVDKDTVSIYGESDTDGRNQLNVGISKLQACLSELKRSLSDRLQQLIDSGFEQLATGVTQGQVKTVLNPLGSIQYNLTEDDLDACAVNDPWIENCIANLESFIKQFRAIFSPGNNDRIISVLTTQMVRRLEQLILRKKFSRFGAIQLEKELRCLFAYLTSVSSAALRDHFTRLLQLCNLLNLDKVEEASFYWSTSSWRFSPNEVRQFLALRVEFTTDAIRRLKL